MRKVRVAPKGMGLNDFVAQQEGFFEAEGIEVEFDIKTFRGTQSSWKGLDYKQRPQDQPYAEGDKNLIQCACVWGSISNASAGMGRFVPDCYGVSPWAILARQLGLRMVMEDEFHTLWWVPETADKADVRAYLRGLERAEKALQADLQKYLPLWEKCVPPEFKDAHKWDYARFTRGERFVFKPMPRSEFDEVMVQVNRWGLDDHLKEKSFDKLTYHV